MVFSFSQSLRFEWQDGHKYDCGTYICANDFSIFYAVAKDFLKIAEDTAAAATSDVPYAKERVAMMLTILKRFMVQAGASGKYHNDTETMRQHES